MDLRTVRKEAERVWLRIKKGILAGVPIHYHYFDLENPPRRGLPLFFPCPKSFMFVMPLGGISYQEAGTTFRRTSLASSRALARRTICAGIRALRRAEGPSHHLLSALSQRPGPKRGCGARRVGSWQAPRFLYS